MTKPVLYLTDDFPRAVAKLRGQTKEFHIITQHGWFKSGDEYYIVLATDDDAVTRFRGMDFSRYEIIGDRLAISPRVIEYATQRIRP